MNAAFLQKAEALLPTLRENLVRPVNAVEMEHTAAGTVTTRAKGEWEDRPLRAGGSICLDFGAHFVGHLTLCLGFTGSHPDAPAWLEIQFAEQPQELFEDVAQYTGWISKGWIQQERLHVDILPAEVTLPRRYAFRYVRLKVLDVSSKYALLLNDCRCLESTSANENAFAPLQTDDALLRCIDTAACRTLRSCMQTVFEDGPKRDRRLWLGDLRLQALSNSVTYQNFDLVKRCLYLFAGTADSDGRLAACVFTQPRVEADDTFLLDYSLLFIVTLRDYYDVTGDGETLRELWPTALRQAVLARSRFGSDGLLREDAYCFVDWNLHLNKQAAGQGIYIYALQALAELAETVGNHPCTAEIAAEAEQKREAARRKLYDPEQGLFISGASRQISWASQVWMVLSGAADAEQGKRIFQRIAQVPGAEKMITPYLYHYYIEALLKIGASAQAMETIKSYWGGMLAAGADTFWEMYDPQNPAASPYGGTIVNSYCHAWSCTPTYFLRKYFADTL